MTTITTLTSGALTGSGNIPATTLDPTCNQVVGSFDITNNLSGSTVQMHMQMDVSQDSGTTWNMLISAGRDKGYDLLHGATSATLSCAVPGVGNVNRMIRGSLLTSAAVNTSMSIQVNAV